MIGNVKRKVIDQTLTGFAQAPGSSKEPIQIGAQHGAGVIEGEQGIESEFLELSLP